MPIDIDHFNEVQVNVFFCGMVNKKEWWTSTQFAKLETYTLSVLANTYLAGYVKF